MIQDADDPFFELPAPDPEHRSVHAVYDPEDKDCTGPWFVYNELSWTQEDAAEAFYLADLLRIVATQVVFLNSGSLSRDQVERWGQDAVAVARTNLEHGRLLAHLQHQIDGAHS